MSLEAESQGAASWRRRHPVLSRSLLYGGGLVLVVLAVFLLVERGKVDRQDRVAYLSARLDTLDVLAATDHTGDELEKALAEIFADPDLPASIRQRALRGRAIHHLKRGDGGAALADLDEAAGLAAADVDRQAIRLERAQALISDDQAQRALEELEGGTPIHPVLRIWHALLRARALDALDRRDDARRALEGGLESLPRPLPRGEPVVFSLTPWTPSEAAVYATQSLADLTPLFVQAAPWIRLLELAPQDLVAAMEAAKALKRGGHEAEADRAWAWVVALGGGQAPEDAASNPDLADLEKKRVEGLKTDAAGSR